MRVTAKLNAPAPSTKTLDPPIDTLAPGSVVPLTVTVASDVTKFGVGDEMSSRGAVVSIENDLSVGASIPAKLSAWTIIEGEPCLNCSAGVNRTVHVGFPTYF